MHGGIFERKTTAGNRLIKSDSLTKIGEETMDKMGIVALIIGLVLIAIGGYAIWMFLPDVIVAVKGLIGIVVLIAGLMALVFGILIIKE